MSIKSQTQKRQTVLDYLHQNPGATNIHVASALGWTYSSVREYLRLMKADGEIGSSTLRVGKHCSYRHTALVETTNYVPQTGGTPRRTKGKPVNDSPGYFRNDSSGEERHPIPNQGGQGALRNSPRTGTCLEMSN